MHRYTDHQCTKKSLADFWVKQESQSFSNQQRHLKSYKQQANSEEAREHEHEACVQAETHLSVHF